MLLAAFGNRRRTRDIDLSGIDLNNDAAHGPEPDSFVGLIFGRLTTTVARITTTSPAVSSPR